MKFRLRAQDLDQPQLIAYDRILRRYGSSCYPQAVNEESDHWRIPVGVYVQSSVIDEKTEKEKIFNLNFQNVGEVLVRKSTRKIMRATSLGTLGKNITEKRASVRRIVEQDLIKILGEKELQIRFGQLRFAFAGLQPIYRTVTRLLLEDYPTYNELLNIGNHYLEQVDLLVEIGYAEYTDQEPRKLVATNKMKELYWKEKNVDKTIDAVFGLVLSEYYYDLQKGRRIAQFMPYVRASTAYYGDAIQFGRLISIKEHRLKESIREYYKGAPAPPRLKYAYPTLIRELVSAQILEYDNEFITGRTEIFERLLESRSKLPLSEGQFSFFG
jgi:hypothetical protein